MPAHRKSRTRRARPSRRALRNRRTLRSHRSFNGGARKKSNPKAASVAAYNRSNNENESASASAAASNRSNNGNAPTELEPSDVQMMRHLESLIPPMLEGNAALAEAARRAALTDRQRNREDSKALYRLHMEIGVFADDIILAYREIAEIREEGLPESYAQYKELFVRRGIPLLQRLANAFYSIVNNNPDPNFKEEHAYLTGVIGEHMEEIAPVKAALRNN